MNHNIIKLLEFPFWACREFFTIFLDFHIVEFLNELIMTKAKRLIMVLYSRRFLSYNLTLFSSFKRMRPAMKKWMVLFLFFGLLCACNRQPDRMHVIAGDYIEHWKAFYPSRAFASGDLESAFRFEEFSPEKIESWVDYNKETLDRLKGLPSEISLDDAADSDLLERQILEELERWEKGRVYENSPLFYAGLISQAVTHILARNELPPQDKLKAVDNRLSGIRAVCAQGRTLLKNGRPHNTERSIMILKSSARFYEEKLPSITLEWPREDAPDVFQGKCRDTAASIRSLADHIRNNIVPHLSLSDSLRKEDYARRLKIYAGKDIIPEELEKIADREIKEVRRLMAEAAAEYWKERYPGEDVPVSFTKLIGRTIQDMEANREDNQQDFFDLFVDLINRAEDFIREKNIATLPEKRTLMTALSPPHFAGASVGGVYPAGPFNPESQTLFYLPSVPDDAPEEVKEGFYRSFNNHFNTMIITHEIYPGHYMQLKIAAASPRLMRSLFADGLYAEGWATLCEVITLDAGWNGFDKLDRLAHLRKRLENATRAYTSVKTHCRGWDRSKVHDFAVEEGLLAPQFALNLWDRVTASPFQLLTYFLGFKKFTEVLEKEKERLGDDFDLQVFCDSVLRAGAVSIDSLPSLLRENNGQTSIP